MGNVIPVLSSGLGSLSSEPSQAPELLPLVSDFGFIDGTIHLSPGCPLIWLA